MRSSNVLRGMRGSFDPSWQADRSWLGKDAPALVECSLCRVVVRAAKGRYRELDPTGSYWIDHAHQPARYARYSDEGYDPGRRNKYGPRSY
jgi:hypothetical protein